LIDSRYAAWRLLATLGLVALGNSGMYVVSVVLPAVQAEFGVGRGDASLPYTLMMVALGLGGIVTGRLADRFGIMRVLWVGAAAVCGGYTLASLSGSIWAFALAHGLLLGLVGSSSTFAPLMADTALWWNKRRGIAVAVCASGNYLAGAIWPPVVQMGIETLGWRQTYVLLGLVCGLGMLVLSLALRQRPPLVSAPAPGTAASGGTDRPFGLSPLRAQLLLCVAGTSCCVAMAMPQVHIVAYCTDLGFGAARGAQMLSLMLACGIASRLISGLICDRIGVGAVWPVSGRHRALVCHHRARALQAARGRCSGRCGHHGHHAGHGLGRLDVGLGVRCDRQLPCCVFERHRLEFAEPEHCTVARDAQPQHGQARLAMMAEPATAS
jgi:MFS family permease